MHATSAVWMLRMHQQALKGSRGRRYRLLRASQAKPMTTQSAPFEFGCFTHPLGRHEEVSSNGGRGGFWGHETACKQA